MKKSVVLLLFLTLSFLMISPLLLAETNSEVDKSYACLKKQLENDCGNTQNTFQNAFSLIAMSHDSGILSKCKSLLDSKKKDNCWPDTSSSSTCSIKSTAIAVLALKYTNSNFDSSVDWILSKKKLASDLTWYLEIDSNNQTACKINGQTITINSDKKISGNDPSGLRKSYNNYWFEITDLRKNYTISCDKDFVTALLYKKPGSNVYYVLGNTDSASAGDSSLQYVDGFCFGISDKCDYEASLWAVLALSKAGEDISPYLPYLTAMSEESVNDKYLPLAFLYMYDNSASDYLSALLSRQKQGKYWEQSGNKIYDTAIALIALQGTTVDEAEKAKEYLLSLRETSGDRQGCWQSFTELILYAGWPKASSSSGSDNNQYCENFNYHCVSNSECPSNETLNNFQCTNIADICCSRAPVQLTCEAKGGMICKVSETCSVSTVPSQDGECCLGACQQAEPLTNECEDNGFTCKLSCGTNEIVKDIYADSCAYDEKCCAKSAAPKTSWWIIILLIVLIVLVILAILFRNRIKIWMFKFKSGYKSKQGPSSTNRPSYPPPSYPQRPAIVPRQIFPQRQPVPQRRPPVQKRDKDKEFDETMKKLRDMSK